MWLLFARTRDDGAGHAVAVIDLDGGGLQDAAVGGPDAEEELGRVWVWPAR